MSQKNRNLKHYLRIKAMRKPIKSRKRAVGKFNFAPHAVPIPKWMQRKMLKNLQQAAVSRVSPKLAARASEILAALGSTSDAGSLNAEHVPVRTEKSISHLPDRQQPQPCKEKMRHRIGKLLGRPVQYIIGFARRNISTKPAHSQ